MMDCGICYGWLRETLAFVSCSMQLAEVFVDDGLQYMLWVVSGDVGFCVVFDATCRFTCSWWTRVGYGWLQIGVCVVDVACRNSCSALVSDGECGFRPTCRHSYWISVFMCFGSVLYTFD